MNKNIYWYEIPFTVEGKSIDWSASQAVMRNNPDPFRNALRDRLSWMDEDVKVLFDFADDGNGGMVTKSDKGRLVLGFPEPLEEDRMRDLQTAWINVRNTYGPDYGHGYETYFEETVAPLDNASFLQPLSGMDTALADIRDLTTYEGTCLYAAPVQLSENSFVYDSMIEVINDFPFQERFFGDDSHPERYILTGLDLINDGSGEPLVCQMNGQFILCTDAPLSGLALDAIEKKLQDPDYFEDLGMKGITATGPVRAVGNDLSLTNEDLANLTAETENIEL